MKKPTVDSANKSFVYMLESFVDQHRLPLLVATALLLLGLPFFGVSRYIMRIIIMIGIYSILGIGLNIMVGHIGEISLGHAGFYAIGAYTSALLGLHYGFNFFVIAVAAIIITFICGVLLGIPTLRLKGPYFTVTTMGFGEIIMIIAMNWVSLTNGTMGLRNIPPPRIFGLQLTLANNGLYYLMLVLVALVSLVYVLMMNSKYGRAFKAIGEDDVAATMMGINTAYYNILALGISAAITGLAGAFYAPMISYIDPYSFVHDVSVLIVSIVILGGMGTLRGMFFGAAVLVAFPEAFRFLMEYRFVMYGLVLIIMMRFRPQGVLGWKSELPYRFPKLARAQLTGESELKVK
ncbi:MAG: branched-chain amino acid ABC transporter permease [Limnochordia bacterium]|jgi:branched-chain amino acid transport system permease protein